MIKETSCHTVRQCWKHCIHAGSKDNNQMISWTRKGEVLGTHTHTQTHRKRKSRTCLGKSDVLGEEGGGQVGPDGARALG